MRTSLKLLVVLWLAWLTALPAQAQKWSFVVFGDTISFEAGSGINTNILGELASVIASERPAFLLFAGDFAQWTGQPVLDVWTNVLGPLYQAGATVFPALGNHDLYSIAAFTNVFGGVVPANGPPAQLGCTYAVSYSNALFVVLNEFAPTNEFEANQAWLEAVLATNTRPHVFAIGHLPAFKVLHTGVLYDPPVNRDRFWNSLSNAHCRIYFCGHDHFYDHLRLEDGDGDPDNDLHQFIVGTGGAPLYPDGVCDGNNGSWTPVRIFHEEQYGYLSVEIDGEIARATWHHRVGTNAYAATPEVFAYSRGPRPKLELMRADDQVALSWTGTWLLEAASQLQGPFTNVPAAASPYRLADLKDEPKFYRLRVP